MMRVRHIDNLKFLAIFTVVAWHVMAMSVGFVNYPLSALCSSASSYMFMFLAGYLAYRTVAFSLNAFVSFGVKSLQRLVLPFVVVGGLYGYLNTGSPLPAYSGAIQHYWFLPVLFFLMIIGYAILWGCVSLKKTSVAWVVMAFCSVWIALSLVYVLGFGDVVPFYLNMCKIYPYFALGAVIARSPAIMSAFEDERIFALSLPLFFVALHYRLPVPLSPLFGLIFWWNVSRKLESRIPAVIGDLGAYTMPIYIFHFFLMPSLSGLGVWISRESSGVLKWNVLNNANFVINLLVAGFISSALIVLCVGLAQIFKCNYWLKMLLMGDLSGRGK